MKYQNLLLSVALLFSTSSFAQDLQQHLGQINTQLTVTLDVPQLCSFTSPQLKINASDYIKKRVTASTNFSTGCYRNTIMDIEVSLGSNPLSTKERRRLPLNGEVGDVDEYIPYTLTFDSLNGPLIGTGADKHTHTFNSSSNSIGFFFMVEEGLDLAPGTYSDQLELTFTYY